MSTIRGDGRIEQILALVTRLAVGELEARQEPTGGGDDLDAIIIGVTCSPRSLVRRGLSLRSASGAGRRTSGTSITRSPSLLSWAARSRRVSRARRRMQSSRAANRPDRPVGHAVRI